MQWNAIHLQSLVGIGSGNSNGCCEIAS